MKNLAIVVGSFHKVEATAMVEEATQEVEAAGHKISDVVWVPGSYEAPIAVKRLLSGDDIDGAIFLGIIERGETNHGFVMAQVVAKQILEIQLEYMKPVGMGVLGPDIFPSQIEPRVRPYARKAAAATIKML